MEAPRTDEDIRDVNTRYHDVAADSYDAKWGIDFGEPGQAQVLMKLRKVVGQARRSPRGFDRSLEIGAGTGYFSLEPPAGGRRSAPPPARTSHPGCSRRCAATRSGWGWRSRRSRPARRSCRSRTRRFDLVLGHAILHHIPDLSKAFAEFHRVLKPGGTVVFAGEPSRYGDRLARVPKRGAAAVAPLWRRAVGARAAGSVPYANGNGNGGAGPDAHAEDHALERFVDIHAFAPGDLAAPRAAPASRT